MRTLQCFLKSFKKIAPKNMKKTTSKDAHYWPNFFFSRYCKPAQNQPKSQFIFHKNCSLRNLCLMTLHTNINMLSKTLKWQ